MLPVWQCLLGVTIFSDFYNPQVTIIGCLILRLIDGETRHCTGTQLFIRRTSTSDLKSNVCVLITGTYHFSLVDCLWYFLILYYYFVYIM